VTVKLSKSKFVAGCQRLKRLYSQVHGPELAAEAHAAAEAIIEQGREVGMLARQLFPDGVEGVLPRKKAATFFQLDECISMMIDLEFASQLNCCMEPTVRRRACNRPMPSDRARRSLGLTFTLCRKPRLKVLRIYGPVDLELCLRRLSGERTPRIMLSTLSLENPIPC